MNLEKLKVYSLTEFETINPDLQQAKTNPASKYGSQRDNYIWSLTPYFIDLLLRVKLEDGDTLIYCDADIYWYESPGLIPEWMGNRSLALFTHRFSQKVNTDVGWYNIGVVGFKNTRTARIVSFQWRSWVINTNHAFYESHGTCGDQKFAELFEKIIGRFNIFVVDEETPHYYISPWSTHFGEGKNLYSHFSHFTLLEDDYRDSYNGEWHPCQYPEIR